MVELLEDSVMVQKAAGLNPGLACRRLCELVKDNAEKREGCAPPLVCCAQGTVGLPACRYRH